MQLCICLGLLLFTLGPGAAAGFVVFIILTPAQSKIMKHLFRIRRKTMEWTDKRAKLLQELLGGMRLVKFFAWEAPFLKRVAGYRNHEMIGIRCYAPFAWMSDFADLWPQQRENDATGSCSELGIGRLYTGYGIYRSFSRIRKFWTSTYSCRYIFLVDLVLGATFTPYDAA